MLYIMRHGRTAWNAAHMLQGKTDVPLNEEGRQTVRAARETYWETHVDICYCSPLARARETAELLLEGRGIPIIPDDRLEEMGFGICEGTKNFMDDPVNPIYPLFQAPETYVEPVEGGESLRDLYARTGDFLENVARPLLSQGKDVLIVGHGAMNASILGQVRHIPVSQFWSAKMKNAELVRLI